MESSIAFPLVVTLALAAVAHRYIIDSPHDWRLGSSPSPWSSSRSPSCPRPSLSASPSSRHRLRSLGTGFEWCAQAIGLHGSVSAWIGIPVVGLIAIGSLRTIRLLRQHRALRLDEAHPIHIAHSSRAIRHNAALAVPARS